MNKEGILTFYMEIISLKKVERSDFYNSSFVNSHSSIVTGC